ncbi:DUF192 domain-containing protein [Kaistia algarum]|uniref:DUF192 domain-containing protein n=1 Tax=Kaistia algarum TaxID=2083279 RepID=UPI000CE72B1C|nr:DUF192 domain-containing protein [Kaistia algarum]MCX5514867.1 DUF192 domain-containing protein [Kaistia algarum]PPE79621.1 DUF192 domain-containing protein [Kaistia algarum]
MSSNRVALAWLPRLFALFLALAGMGALLAPAGAKAPDSLIIRTTSGDHRFTLEWATTEAEREHGLMGRKQLAVDHGMIFDFGDDQDVAFWMKNTPLSLDMVFIAADGTVKRVEKRAKPYSLSIIPSGAPVRYVLEVVGGTASRLGIAAGDKVVIPAR